MEVVHLTESRESMLRMSSGQARSFNCLGARLASQHAWWGVEKSVKFDRKRPRSLISCRPETEDLWAVRVLDAVGVVSCGDLQLVVHPKIPLSHFVYLLQHSGRFPKIDISSAAMSAGTSFWELVAEWFVVALERLLTTGLFRDYQECDDWLDTIRGTVEVEATARALYEGRVAFACHFDEFTYNSPINRVLKGAAGAVAESLDLRWDLRRRAMRAISSFDEVNDLLPGDLRCAPDARHAHYVDTFELARHVLQSVGRFLEEGEEVAKGFLLRTPAVIEDGVRKILINSLPELSIRKPRLPLEGSRVTVSPDLLFQDGLAVADIKYKRNESDWNRTDLYEVVAFATAFQARRAAVVDFDTDDVEPRDLLQFGNVRVANITWLAKDGLSPQLASSVLVDAVRNWLIATNQ